MFPKIKKSNPLLLIVCTLTTIQVTTLAQGNNNRKLTKKQKFIPTLQLQPHIGNSWQSTLFKPVFDFSYIDELFFTPYPINFEKGTQGFGLDVGTSILVDLSKNNKIGVRPNVRVRYDYWYGDTGTGFLSQYHDETKDLLLDIGLHAVFSQTTGNNKELSASLGYTINQTGKNQFFDLSNTVLMDAHAYRNFQYTSINFGLSYDLIKLSEQFFINTSLQANYIPDGHPAYPYRDFMTLGIGVSVRYKPESLIFKLRK